MVIMRLTLDFGKSNGDSQDKTPDCSQHRAPVTKADPSKNTANFLNKPQFLFMGNEERRQTAD